MTSTAATFHSGTGDWQHRLSVIIDTMQEISQQTDPQEMVAAYGRRMRQIVHRDRSVSISRRGQKYPEFRVTRDSDWTEPVNPWKERDRLPVLRGGLLAELLYSDQARIIDELVFAHDDPAADYFTGQRSLIALPLFDKGVALNMVVFMRKEPAGFGRQDLPEFVWMANLFGRAVHNLVLSDELKRANEAVDRELEAVAAIQRSLLPAELPEIPTMGLAAHYQTSRRAGGDYYDVFPLPGDKWGILIADVSGHGIPAAVLMAITHALAHTHPGAPCPPATLLSRLNRELVRRYTRSSGTFVTAFYGVYDPATRHLSFSNAGHNPPRLKRCEDGSLTTLDGAAGLPLGISPDEEYSDRTHALRPGDQVLFYTDGITEAFNPAGEMFDTSRLDRVLTDCRTTATCLIGAVLEAVDRFAEGRPADDDRTLLVAKIT